MEKCKHIISFRCWHCVLSKSRLLATVLFGVIFLLTSSAAPAQEIRTACDIPIVGEWEETILTCHFGVDVGRLKLDVKVVHYTTENKERPVLTCLWEDENQNCMDESNYSLEGELTDTLQLHISHATEYHVGRYACVIVAREPQISDLCTFTLKEKSISSPSNVVITDSSTSLKIPPKGVKTACGIPPVPKGERTTLTCYFGMNVADWHHDVIVYHYISGIEKQSVLTCLWDAEKRDCIANVHYSFDHVITDILHLDIPHAAEHHVGKYECIDTQYETNSYDVCEFILKEAVVIKSAISGDSLNGTTETARGRLSGGNVALIVICIVGLLLAVALVVFYRHRGMFPANNRFRLLRA